MAGLRISTSLNLHDGSRENIKEYIETGLSFLKRMGFDAADMPSPLFLGMGEAWEEYIKAALEAGEANGIRFELCHLPFGIKPEAPEEEQERFNLSVHRAIDAAKMLGVSYAVVHPNCMTMLQREYDEKAQHEMVIRHLAPFAEHAAKIGLNIVVENMRYVYGNEPVHRYCGEPEELCRVADELGIGICWDFGHANINGLVQSEALKYVGKRLKMLHVNDNHAYNDIHLAPFMGKVDWQDAMQGLKAIDYQGLFNYEVASFRVPAPLKEDFARYLVNAAHTMLDMMENEE